MFKILFHSILSLFVLSFPIYWSFQGWNSLFDMGQPTIEITETKKQPIVLEPKLAQQDIIEEKDMKQDERQQTERLLTQLKQLLDDDIAAQEDYQEKMFIKDSTAMTPQDTAVANIQKIIDDANQDIDENNRQQPIMVALDKPIKTMIKQEKPQPSTLLTHQKTQKTNNIADQQKESIEISKKQVIPAPKKPTQTKDNTPKTTEYEFPIIEDNRIKPVDIVKIHHRPLLAEDNHEQQQTHHEHSITNKNNIHLASYRQYDWLPESIDSTQANHNKSAKIAIIIDDLGIDYARSKKMIELDPRLTLSFLPYGRHTKSLAKEAQMFGNDILLHLPMEPEALDKNPGLNALNTRMDSKSLKSAIDWNLQQFDGFIGVNNHMGSKFTSWQSGMEFLFDSLKHRDLFFIDSFTTANSRAIDAARAKNIDMMRRDVFLDHDKSREQIIKQFRYLEKLAKKQGYAIAIAHPYDNSFSVLQQWVQALSQRNDIELVNLKTLWRHVITQPVLQQHQQEQVANAVLQPTQKATANSAQTQELTTNQQIQQLQQQFAFQSALALAQTSNSNNDNSNSDDFFSAFTLDGYRALSNLNNNNNQDISAVSHATHVPKIKKLTSADMPALQSEINQQFLINYQKQPDISINNIVNW